MKLSPDKPDFPERRKFLSGRLTREQGPVFPPWSKDILSNCTGCEDCVSHCPQQILSLNDSNLPVVSFRENECTFCKSCANACEEPVFDLSETPWQLNVSVLDTCFLNQGIYCRSCGDNCPEGAIRFELRVGNQTDWKLNNERCSGCGACVASCPASAVQISPWSPRAH